jgi:hypothetical protein
MKEQSVLEELTYILASFQKPYLDLFNVSLKLSVPHSFAGDKLLH